MKKLIVLFLLAIISVNSFADDTKTIKLKAHSISFIQDKKIVEQDDSPDLIVGIDSVVGYVYAKSNGKTLFTFKIESVEKVDDTNHFYGWFSYPGEEAFKCLLITQPLKSCLALYFNFLNDDGMMIFCR